MQANGMIFWDWNGTLMDDVDFHPRVPELDAGEPTATRSGTIWPQYRELFAFPIEDYYIALAGSTFAAPLPAELAERFMAHYTPGWTPVPAAGPRRADTLAELARRGWRQSCAFRLPPGLPDRAGSRAGSAGLFYRVARPCGHLRREQRCRWAPTSCAAQSGIARRTA